MKCDLKKLMAEAKPAETSKGLKIFKKAIRFLDNMIDKGLLILCILVFLMGSYALYDSYRVYTDAVDNDILKFKPGYDNEGEELDKQIEGFMAAWITMNGSDIDYPVMQGEDNSEYLSKDPFGEYSLAGSIFLDARNNPAFMDDYSLIYGHHMEHGMMFGALDAWLSKEYCDEHRDGELIVGDTTYKLKVFAIVESEATREELFSPTEVDKGTVLGYITEHAKILYEEDIPKEEQIVALSTCKFPDTAERTIVVCKLLK